MKRPVLPLLLLMLGAAHACIAADQDAAELFQRYKNRIFQIRVVDLGAENKSALGTGFLVAEDGLIATNYHVISALVNEPEKFRLEYLDQQGAKGDVQLLDIDVVSDLALLKAGELDLEPLEIPDDMPVQGDTIYSLGNPYDIGFTVIPGTYNGIETGSYYRHIHFSGSINAGMSGGPVLDRNGRVVGVNVSSAGNQLSFLVPVDALRDLINGWRERDGPVVDFHARIARQLRDNQQEMLGGMLQRDWPYQTLGSGTVLGEMQPFVKCWGSSSEEREPVKSATSLCRSTQQIFLNPGFSTGVISYQFFWMEADKLSTPRFLRYYWQLFHRFIPDNLAGEEDVTNFSCEDFFVADQARHTDKAILCVRAYRNYRGLYDALYIRGSVDDSGSAFISHFTLAGLDRGNITAFLEKFQQVVHR